MAWDEKQAVQEYLRELTDNLRRKEYGTVMSSEANEIGLEKQLEISWSAALKRYFDETMQAPETVSAYLAYPCARTDLQLWLLILIPVLILLSYLLVANVLVYAGIVARFRIRNWN